MSPLCSQAFSRRIDCSLNPIVRSVNFMNSRTASNNWPLVDRYNLLEMNWSVRWFPDRTFDLQLMLSALVLECPYKWVVVADLSFFDLWVDSVGACFVLVMMQSLQKMSLTVWESKTGASSNLFDASRSLSPMICPSFLYHSVAESFDSGLREDWKQIAQLSNSGKAVRNFGKFMWEIVKRVFFIEILATPDCYSCKLMIQSIMCPIQSWYLRKKCHRSD